MANSFANLRKNRSKGFDKLNDHLQDMSGNKKYGDDRYWKLEVDKAGNGYAVIRFLPAPEGEDVPFVRIFDHGFKGPGGWYIEKSLRTIGQDDPLAEINSALWDKANAGDEAAKAQARNQKQRKSFHANIYVVKDPANPENEGKVFLFKFGPELLEKLNRAMNPEFQDEERVDPFDMWEGADFKLKARNKDNGFRTYEASGFAAQAELGSSDDEREAIWKQAYSLADLIDPKNYPTYDELKSKLTRVLKLSGGSDNNTVNVGQTAEARTSRTAEAPAQRTAEAASIPMDDGSDDDDDGLDFFKELAND